MYSESKKTAGLESCVCSFQVLYVLDTMTYRFSSEAVLEFRIRTPTARLSLLKNGYDQVYQFTLAHGPWNGNELLRLHMIVELDSSPWRMSLNILRR